MAVGVFVSMDFEDLKDGYLVFINIDLRKGYAFFSYLCAENHHYQFINP